MTQQNESIEQKQEWEAIEREVEKVFFLGNYTYPPKKLTKENITEFVLKKLRAKRENKRRTGKNR